MLLTNWPKHVNLATFYGLVELYSYQILRHVSRMICWAEQVCFPKEKPEKQLSWSAMDINLCILIQLAKANFSDWVV